MTINNIGRDGAAYEQLRIRQQQELEREPKTDKSVNASTSGTDNISVSEDARLLATALKTAQETPDTRAEEIARLKEQVESGTYSANGRTIAEKLVSEELDLFR